jgi:protein-disulfide isomerase
MSMLLPVRRLVYSMLAILAASCALAPEAAAPAATAAPPREFNMLGDANAPVAIIEFTDLQCPYCAHFAIHTFPRLKKTYIDHGKLLYISRDLPLASHAYAVPAAVATRCAGEQGRYWEFRHAVFDAQQRLPEQPYAEFARELGLDLERFAACQADGRQLKAVREDAAFAAYRGLNSTPSFAIGRLVGDGFLGETISGEKSFDFFAQKIDALLRQ